jgi:hypothetical protein
MFARTLISLISAPRGIQLAPRPHIATRLRLNVKRVWSCGSACNWAVAFYCLVVMYHRFGGISCLRLQASRVGEASGFLLYTFLLFRIGLSTLDSFLYPQDGDDGFLQNVGTYLPAKWLGVTR